MTTYAAILIIVALTLCILWYNFVDLRKHKEGTPEMQELAGIIREGAKTFMIREYRVIIPTVAIVALLCSLVVERASGLTFLLGALMSSLACVLGMRGGTYANVRTANAARKTHAMSRTVRIALMGGSVSGYSVHAFGLLGFVLVLMLSGIETEETGRSLLLNIACNPTAKRLMTYSLGCSLVAMFNRVAGGNYTKAADISADIVGKNVHNMPEDDSRMPNTIADFIGDCVNDIAGNVSDLLESFVATPVACVLISLQYYADNLALLLQLCQYPLLLAGGGLLASVIGVNYIILVNRKRKKYIEQGGIMTEVEASREAVDPAVELNRATYLSAGAVTLIGLIGARYVFSGMDLPANFALGWMSPWVASVLGIFSSVAVGRSTEYYTSTANRPVQQLARMTEEGDAFVVTKGDAIGSRSVLLPVLVIGVAMIIANTICGIYGIAVAALGMLSFVGTTVSIDAFGPVADNAGGIAESCHLDPSVREITDQLDAVGNTTAAIGKGNAIGAAAFATVSLIMSYLGSYPASDYSSPTVIVKVLVGAIIGGALIEYFTAILTDNTILSAKVMAEEGERQLAIPGVLEGTVKPDYMKVIQMAADQALRHMMLPSILALVVPIIGGTLFGPDFIAGFLGGSVIVAITRAIFMGNSGGAFDNAKKYIEAGMLEVMKNGHVLLDEHGVAEVYQKNSAPHKAAVVGDTVGDTRKDVVGVALDIFIKTMSTESNALAGLFYRYSVF